MILGLTFMNLFAVTSIYLLILILIFPIESLLKKYLELSHFEIKKITITTIFITIIFIGLIIIEGSINSILTLIFSIFSFWAFLFGFNTNRKYIYLLAIGCLIMVPFLLILNLNGLAEFLAVLTYLLLVIGVLKDILYEKIFKLENDI